MGAALIMLIVLAGGIVGGLALLRLTIAPPAPPVALWEVVPVAVDAGEGAVRLEVLAPAGRSRRSGGSARTIHLVGDRPPLGVLSAIEGWCSTGTPVLLRMDALEGASLHGPEASVVGLTPHRRDGTAGLPCNTVEAFGRTYLRTTSPYDRALHLVPRADETGSGAGRSAVVPLGDAAWAGYDAGLLMEPCWAPRTQCGFDWPVMASHDQEVAALDAAAHAAARHDGAGTYICPACTWLTLESGRAA